MLEIENLSAWYGEAQALREATLSVAEGEVVTLVGRNGAGKTTLVRCLMGLHKHLTGSIRLDGREITSLPAHKRARAGLGWVQDDRGIFANLSVEENLLLPPKVSESAWTLEQVYDAFPALGSRRRAGGTTLSGGEQQMLALARGLAVDPALLFLDELSMGLAPIIVEQLYEVVAAVAREGVSILVVEQFARTVLGVADYAAIMLHGRVVSVGQPGDIASELEDAYLGTGSG